MEVTYENDKLKRRLCMGFIIIFKGRMFRPLFTKMQPSLCSRNSPQTSTKSRQKKIRNFVSMYGKIISIKKLSEKRRIINQIKEYKENKEPFDFRSIQVIEEIIHSSDKKKKQLPFFFNEKKKQFRQNKQTILLKPQSIKNVSKQKNFKINRLQPRKTVRLEKLPISQSKHQPSALKNSSEAITKRKKQFDNEIKPWGTFYQLEVDEFF